MRNRHPAARPRPPVLLTLACLLALAACASPAPRLPPPAADAQVAELARAIRALGEDIDRHEANRAARIAFDYSRELAGRYGISDSPLVHNLKVNLGLRDRGLCIHWTRDMLTRLQQERFVTLDLHWAIANAENAFRLEHSTAVISRRGADLHRGLVLDPWRNAGALHWAPTLADADYHWRPRAEALAERAALKAAVARQDHRP